MHEYRSRALRCVVIVSTVVALAMASTSSAGASVASRVNGSVTGQAPFEFVPKCVFVHQRIIATVDITHGPTASLLVDTCVDFGGAGFVVTGTFRFRAPSGTLSGTMSGTANDAPAPEFDYTLHVEHGTRGFQRASGSLHLTGVWYPNGVGSGPVVGALTATLTH